MPAALGSSVVQSVSGAQSGAGHPALAGGQSIVALTKHLLTFLCFVSKYDCKTCHRHGDNPCLRLLMGSDVSHRRAGLNLVKGSAV